jgi:hypothetical protein
LVRRIVSGRSKLGALSFALSKMGFANDPLSPK